MLSTANKPSDYTEEDALNLDLLTSTVWTVVERIKAEAQLREEKELLGTTLQSIGEGVIVTDDSGTIRLMNPLGEQMAGLSQSDVVGKKFSEAFQVVNMQTRESLPDPVSYVLKTDQILLTPQNAGLVRKDGSEIYISGSVAPIVTATGKLSGVVMTARDVTRENEQEEQIEAFLNVNLDLLCVVDLEGTFVKVNKQFETTLGYQTKELYGKSLYDFVLEEDIQETQATMQDLTDLKSIRSFINRYRCKDGSVRELEWRAQRYGSFIFGSARDVTERNKLITAMKQTEENLKQSELKYRLITESTLDVIWILNLNTLRFTYMSPSMVTLTGFAPEESLTHSLEEMIEADYLYHIYEMMPVKMQELMATSDSTATYVFDLKLKCKNGGSVWAEASVKLRFAENQEIEVVGVTRNIEERKKFEAEMIQLSYYDQLTGLYNRRFYEEEQKRLDVERSLPITLVTADVNGLKLTNDIFGHGAGDELLKTFAELLKKTCRASDIMARVGGDEFALLLPETDSQQAESMILRIQNAIAQYPLDRGVLSVSFGWKTKNRADQSISELSSQADDIMYHQKLINRESFEQNLIHHLINTLYEHDKTEKLHSENVAETCVKIGIALGLSPEEIADLELAGLLHDIGKIGIDRSILKKPGTLTIEEREHVNRHPEIGYQVLRGLNLYRRIAEVVLYHHERPDGKGYPKGITGSDIPLPSKVISVSDAYCSMSTNSVSRDILNDDEIVQEFKLHSGTQFDEHIAKTFVQHVLKKAW